MPSVPVAKLTSKGQLTVPKEIRDQLKLQAGDHIKFITDKNGKVQIEPRNWNFESLRGIVKSKRKRPPTIEEMNEDIAAGWAGEPRK